MDAKLAALLDKQDITEALTRFSRGMDRLDRDLFLSAFHDDAEMAAGPFVGTVQECADWSFPMHVEGQILTHHALLNITIDLDGDTAHTETYYLFVARNKDESLVQAGGRYIDRFERRDGEWKIALRTNAIEWAGLLPSIPIPFSDVADLYGNGAPARDKSDPSYRRPLTNLRERNIP
jgi:ketosteroid isomerase-like protein